MELNETKAIAGVVGLGFTLCIIIFPHMVGALKLK